MAKGIIVVDMPESCAECLLLDFEECCKLQKDYYVNFNDQKANCPSNHFQKKWTAKAETHSINLKAHFRYDVAELGGKA